MHLVASWPNAPYSGIFNHPPSAEMQYSNAIYEEPPVFKDGHLILPDKPGHGVAIDKSLIMT